MEAVAMSCGAMGLVGHGHRIHWESETQRMCCERKSLQTQNCATDSLSLYASTCKDSRIRYLYIVSKLPWLWVNKPSEEMSVSLFEQLNQKDLSAFKNMSLSQLSIYQARVCLQKNKLLAMFKCCFVDSWLNVIFLCCLGVDRPALRWLSSTAGREASTDSQTYWSCV